MVLPNLNKQQTSEDFTEAISTCKMTKVRDRTGRRAQDKLEIRQALNTTVWGKSYRLVPSAALPLTNPVRDEHKDD